MLISTQWLMRGAGVCQMDDDWAKKYHISGRGCSTVWYLNLMNLWLDWQWLDVVDGSTWLDLAGPGWRNLVVTGNSCPWLAYLIIIIKVFNCNSKLNMIQTLKHISITVHDNIIKPAHIKYQVKLVIKTVYHSLLEIEQTMIEEWLLEPLCLHTRERVLGGMSCRVSIIPWHWQKVMNHMGFFLHVIK